MMCWMLWATGQLQGDTNFISLTVFAIKLCSLDFWIKLLSINQECYDCTMVIFSRFLYSVMFGVTWAILYCCWVEFLTKYSWETFHDLVLLIPRFIDQFGQWDFHNLLLLFALFHSAGGQVSVLDWVCSPKVLFFFALNLVSRQSQKLPCFWVAFGDVTQCC